MPAPVENVKKSSTEWKQELCPNVIITDPDGWDRASFDFSWNELITKLEFLKRLGKSTSMNLQFRIYTDTLNQAMSEEIARMKDESLMWAYFNDWSVSLAEELRRNIVEGPQDTHQVLRERRYARMLDIARDIQSCQFILSEIDSAMREAVLEL